MTDSDLTLKVLVDMRDELRTIRGEAENTNRQLGELRSEVGELRGDVGELRGEMRGVNQRLDLIEHTMVDFGTQLVLLGRYTKNSVSRHDSDVDRHDEEIADLRTRVAKLEAKD